MTLSVVAACGGGDATPDASQLRDGQTNDARSDAPPPVLDGPLSKANIFYSGHSLIDNPVPDDTHAIVAGFGYQSQWNQQNGIGSPIRVRTRGSDPSGSTFPGYRTGKNREGNNMDVVAELRNPATIGAGQRYDVLVLAERHDGPGVVQWEDTVRYTRHFHERMIEGNAAATSYLYHAWWSVADKATPAPWIAYERTAARMWQCVATRINVSLAASGRTDRVHYLPAGLALAELVDRATTGTVPGITGASTSATMNVLFSDDVHLQRVGQYYMSLVVYASIFRRNPSGAFTPPGVTNAQASALQTIAWDVVSNYYAAPAAPTMPECQAHMRDQMCPAFYSYAGMPQNTNSCVGAFTAQNSNNPFYYNANADAAYWFPAP